MLVPNSFKQAIADTFYDKTFTIATVTTGKDAEGGATATVGTPVSHKGNVQFSLSQKMAEIYGISEDIDIAITTNIKPNINDRLAYDGVQYDVRSVKPRDSHVLIIGSKR